MEAEYRTSTPHNPSELGALLRGRLSSCKRKNRQPTPSSSRPTALEQQAPERAAAELERQRVQAEQAEEDAVARERGFEGRIAYERAIREAPPLPCGHPWRTAKPFAPREPWQCYCGQPCPPFLASDVVPLSHESGGDSSIMR